MNFVVFGLLAAVVGYLFRRPLIDHLIFPVFYCIYVSKFGYVYHHRSLTTTREKQAHTSTSATELPSCKIIPLAILGDNYSYLIIDREGQQAVLVDPADPLACLDAVSQHQVKLTAVLTTHKHWDHAGGNREIMRRCPDVRVYGPVQDGLVDYTDNVVDEQVLNMGTLQFRVLSTPGHTVGHVMYLLENTATASALFSGDSLFVCGCGRFFEGDAKTNYDTFQKVVKLDPSTLLFPGHEYALTNLRFAVSLDAHNEPLQHKLQLAQERRGKGLSMIPSTIREELMTNPFLRPHHSVFAYLSKTVMSDETSRVIDVLQQLRSLRDKFR